VKCPRCGTEGEGNFCARCGTPLPRGGDQFCPNCGAGVRPGDLFCGECGAPVADRPKKGLAAYIPWILSAVALAVFAVGIVLLVQRNNSPRGAEGTITGGVITPSQDEAPGAPMAGGGAEGGTMPTAQQLAAMPPKEAADRLFNRAMEMQQEGAPRASFFANMGVEAYQRVAPEKVDADVRFHVGLLQLAAGNPPGAAAEADTILGSAPKDLLGLLLASRAARAEGQTGKADAFMKRYQAAFKETNLDSRPDYQAHRDMLEKADPTGT
jgi:predicted nucleic acid-binding Zn ribbon protein